VFTPDILTLWLFEQQTFIDDRSIASNPAQVACQDLIPRPLRVLRHSSHHQRHRYPRLSGL
jgi:hypothetical protein